MTDRTRLRRSTALALALVAGATVLGTPVGAFAQTTWTGAAGSDFSDAANWDNGPPQQTEPAIINGNGSEAPDVAAAATISILELWDGDLSVSGATLTVTTEVIQSGGTLTTDATGRVDALSYTLADGVIGSGSTVGGGVFVMTGGMLDGTVASTLFGQTGGEAGAATIHSLIEVVALGGGIGILGPDGVQVANTGAGDVTVTTRAGGAIDNDAPIGNGHGIEVTAETGNVTVTLGDKVTGTGDGIHVVTKGNVTIGGDGDVAGGVGSDGIEVVMDGAGLATVSVNGKISGDPGIVMSANAGGSLTVDGAGDVTGNGAEGVKLTSTGGNGTLTVTRDGNLTGATTGIDARTSNGGAGSGRVQVTVSDGYTVEGEAAAGVITRTDNGTNIVDGDGTIKGVTFGVDAQSTGTLGGTITVGGSGATISSGDGSITINAQVTNVAAGADVIVGRNGDLTNTGTGATVGINATNAGSGKVDVDSGAITLDDASTGTGINASSSKGGAVTVDNGGAINGGAHGITAATTGAGTVTVTTGAAIGTTDAVSIAGIVADTVDGEGEINVNHAITSEGAGVLGRSTGSGAIDVNHASGLITADVGVSVVHSGTGPVSIDLTGNAAIDAASIGVRIEGADTAATLTIGATNTMHGDGNAVVSLAKTLTVDNNGTVSVDTASATTAALNVQAGTATFNNLEGGEVAGMIASSADAISLTVNNDAGASWTLNPGGTAALDSADDEINNSGLFRASGATTVSGLETFNNQAGGVFEINAGGAAGTVVTFDGLGTFNNRGTIDLSNTPPGGAIVVDRLVLDGGYAGEAGSTIVVDIDLGSNNAGGTPQLSDQIVITDGAFTGRSTVVFNVVDLNGLGLQDSPIIVIDLDATQDNTGVFDSIGLPQLGGIIEYQFGQIGEDWGVTSTVNLSAAGGIAANISLAQSIIGTMVQRPSSPYVSGLAGSKDAHVGPAIWMRGIGGQASASTKVADDFGFTSKAEVDLAYLGAQVGADLGWFNIDGTDLTVNAGLTGGYNAGTTTQDVVSTFSGAVTGVTEGDFDSRFVGVYVTLAKARFFADIQARFDRTDFTFDNSNPLVGLDAAKVESDRFSVIGSLGYAADLGNGFTFVPSAGLGYARTKTTGLTFDNGSTLSLDAHDSWIGFGGATLVKTFIMPDQVSALSPFITGTVYNDFGDDPTSVYTFDGAERIIATENIGTFGELSLGADYARIFAGGGEGNPMKQLNASLRGDFKFSDRLLAAGLNVQMRLQF